MLDVKFNAETYTQVKTVARQVILNVCNVCMYGRLNLRCSRCTYEVPVTHKLSPFLSYEPFIIFGATVTQDHRNFSLLHVRRYGTYVNTTVC